MGRLLTKSTLRKLYDLKLYTNPYLATIEQIMIGRKENDDETTVQPRELLVDMYFHDEETTEIIHKKVLDVLKTCSNEGW